MTLSKFQKKAVDYFSTSYRRKKIDALLKQHQELYHGVVLDIGGRDRGKFKKPKTEVTKWIFADIITDFHPDIVLDVTDMKNIGNSSIDVINAIELFEHVSHPEKGLSECFRSLKSGGVLIATTPFLYGIHSDPYDFQRWTEEKWKLVLKETGYSAVEIYPMGTGISVFLDMIKLMLRYSNRLVKYFSFLFYPLFDLLERLDDTRWARTSFCKNYVGGYFIVAKKN